MTLLYLLLRALSSRDSCFVWMLSALGKGSACHSKASVLQQVMLQDGITESEICRYTGTVAVTSLLSKTTQT